MSNSTILTLILLVVLGIGVFMIAEENESPADAMGDAIENTADDIEDATN